MSKTRFTGYIHSIVAHQVMVSPDGKYAEQFKCALDDFESIMPNQSGGFTFHVKRDRIGVEHYRRWLGMEKIEANRLENLEQGLLQLIDLIKTPPKYIVDPSTDFSELSPEEFASQLMTDKVR